MRNDIKIKAVRRKYNSAGYALYIMILELLTSNEYFEIDLAKLKLNVKQYKSNYTF
jgi:hypothetical protein